MASGSPATPMFTVIGDPAYSRPRTSAVPNVFMGAPTLGITKTDDGTDNCEPAPPVAGVNVGVGVAATVDPPGTVDPADPA